MQALIHNKTSSSRSVQVAFSGYNPAGQAVSIYEIRPATAGNVWDYRCYYNNSSWPCPNTTSPLPSPTMSACPGATYTRTVPAYSVTMLDFGGTPIAGPPVASDDSYSTQKAVALNVPAPGVLANDVDPEGETLTAVKVSDPSHGSVTLNSNGSFLYTPTAGYVGADSFTYKAYDNSEGYSNVVTVSITVNPIPPMVSITSPANGTTFTEPASFTINATATDSDGTVTKVEFYQGSTLLGTDTTSPYSYAWTNVVAGNYSLTAKATDNDGAVTTSSPINITGRGTNVTPVLGTWYKLINRGSSNGCHSMAVSGGSTADGAQIILWTYGGALDQQWQLVDKGSGYRQFINRNSSKAAGIADACTADGGWVQQQTAGSGNHQQWTLTATDSGYYAITNRNSGKVMCIYGGGVGDGSYVCQWGTYSGGLDQQWGFQIPPGSGGNNPPTVSITSPANGATYTAPASVTINATASDSDGTVSKVDFYQGATLLGTDTTSPYSYSWTNVAAGSYSLTAKATDNLGAEATSAAVGITVNPAGNVPPTVSITSPANGATFTAPASVTINATASDSDGTVSKVDFYQGATLLGTDTSSPYSYSWTSVAAGSYSLTAKATDNLGAVTTSTAVGITVNPPGGAGTGLKGDYYDNMDFTNLLVTRTDATVNFSWGDGSPDPLIGVDTFSVRWTGQVQPAYSETYTFYTNTDDGVRLWVNSVLLVDKWVDQGATEWSGTIALTAGTKYDIKMEYYENGGGASAQLSWSSSSQAKQIIPQSQLYPAAGNVPPTVSITSPANGATFTAPASVTINATASDSDGTVSKVDFYQGATLLGTDTTSPYSYAWTSVAAGSYSLIAKATDNLGAVTTSTAVGITVNPANVPPTVFSNYFDSSWYHC